MQSAPSAPKIADTPSDKGMLHLSAEMRFRLQPIMHVHTGAVFGHELLYRGPRHFSWEDIDKAVLDALQRSQVAPGVLFVNMSHQSLLHLPAGDFLNASQTNDLYFELSEAITDQDMFMKVSAKVNQLCAAGVRIAIDDFGSGHDGLKRLSSLDKVSAIKIDGDIIRNAYKRRHAAETLKAMVTHWNRTGIATIAECIESAELLEFARGMEFHMTQGFHIDDLLAPAATN